MERKEYKKILEEQIKESIKEFPINKTMPTFLPGFKRDKGVELKASLKRNIDYISNRKCRARIVEKVKRNPKTHSGRVFRDEWVYDMIVHYPVIRIESVRTSYGYVLVRDEKGMQRAAVHTREVKIDENIKEPILELKRYGGLDDHIFCGDYYVRPRWFSETLCLLVPKSLKYIRNKFHKKIKMDDIKN